MSTFYRAVYWISADRHAIARLTGPDQADLSNCGLLALGTTVARANALDIDGGRIVIEQGKE